MMFFRRIFFTNTAHVFLVVVVLMVIGSPLSLSPAHKIRTHSLWEVYRNQVVRGRTASSFLRLRQRQPFRYRFTDNEKNPAQQL
jgi:hypothetical protein